MATLPPPRFWKYIGNYLSVEISIVFVIIDNFVIIETIGIVVNFGNIGNNELLLSIN